MAKPTYCQETNEHVFEDLNTIKDLENTCKMKI